GLSDERERRHGRTAPLGGGRGRARRRSPGQRPRGQRAAPRRGEGSGMTGVVIVTHYRLGEEFLQALRLIVPDAPPVRAVSVDPKQSVDQMREATAKAVRAADTGDGGLVLTDMAGATPSYLSVSCRGDRRVGSGSRG